MSINTKDFITYNNEGFFTCKVCTETKEQHEFRKLKGGKVSTVCRGCTNVKHIPDPMKAHLSAIRCRAKSDGVPFDLTLEDLAIPSECPALGILLNTKWGESPVSGVKDNAPSVDRIIPSLGYVKGNTQVISYRANRIKTDASKEEILSVYEWLAEQIATAQIALIKEKVSADVTCSES